MSGSTAPTPTNCATSCNDGGCNWTAQSDNNKECYDDYVNYVLPHVTLLTWDIPWSKDAVSTGIVKSKAACLSTCNSGTPCSGCNGALAADFSLFETQVGYYTYPTYSGNIGFVLSHVANGTNNGYGQCSSASGFCNVHTPWYVFAPAWASGGGFPPAWIANTYYLGGQFVSDSFGAVWINTTSPSGSCTSGTSGPSGSDGSCAWSASASSTAQQHAISCSSYPGYLLTQGLAANFNSSTCGDPLNPACTLSQLASGVPVFQEPAYYLAAQAFDNQVIAHYSTANPFTNNKILYIRVGTVVGGENFLWCNTEQQGRVTPSNSTQMQSVFLNFTNAMFSNAAASTSNGMQLMAATNGGTSSAQKCDWADKMGAQAVGYRFHLGSEGLTNTDLTGFSNGRVCTGQVGTSNPGCSNDWCNLASAYQGQTAFRELQLAGISDPTCVGTDSSCKPGSLTVILPFATQNHANVFELFAQDLFTAYNPNWTLNATYGSAYAAAIANAAAGIPAATSQTQGNVVIQGGATQQ